MTDEASLERAIDGDERQRHDGRRQDDVGDEQRKVDDAGPSLSPEGARAVERMVDVVGDEKEGGDQGRLYHARLVCGNVAAPDEHVARGQQRGARRVQTRVDQRQRRGHARCAVMVRAAPEHEIADNEDDREGERADRLEHEPVAHDADTFTTPSRRTRRPRVT